MDLINDNTYNSVNTSSNTIKQQQQSSSSNKTQSVITFNQEDDSGIEQDSTILIRICINEQSLQKVFKFNLDETVWLAKHKVLSNLARELKDGINYGFYLPSYQGRAGKFLDDCRMLREYPINNGQYSTLEFKYKKRVYKFMKLNPKEIKTLNTKANLKRFLDYVRTNQTYRVAKYLDKGVDPNFHSDLGETPLTLASSLLEPREMIMNLYNGGAHLDFRSRDTLTAMHKAAQLDNDKALNILLELGGFADVKDSKNLTPLFYAMTNASSIKCVELLLYNGSLIGCKDENNWQEIHYACKLGLSQHLDHLIYFGADLNARNNSGNTPLHICAIYNKETCARTLLFRGADGSARNLSNQTAFETAIITGNQSIAEVIEKFKPSDCAPMKEKPQFNLKRRSVYLEAGSNYGTIYSNSTAITNMSNNNSLTKSSVSTLNNPWNVNNGFTAASLRSRSMPKLDNNANNNNTTNSTIKTINSNGHSTNNSNNNNSVQTVINSGSSSPTSRSRSISSDDHGIGSASLSQLSGSPNIEYAYPRKRLYASIPDRRFICIKGYKPIQAGELELRKGDIVEILSVGEQGFWEGRSNSCEGWFPSDCVEEVQLPKDYNDSLVVKRKTLLDIITQNDYNTPRTVVLQRGKKGYGFVLRGAKVTDQKFEPTVEIPALQFLENVDKGSNADKAGLKALDFVLEINNVDVTCRTHDDCVKLIKKSGDTLALKVLTVSYTNAKQSDHHNNHHQCTTNGSSSSHYASTTVVQSKIMNNQSPSSTIQSNKIKTPSPPIAPPPPPSIPQQPAFLSIPQDYTDGTKSLPHKNKPIPPKRHPNTSLTSIDSTCMTSFIYSNNTLSKSSTNLTTFGENQEEKQQQDGQLNSNSSSYLTTSSISSSLSTNTDNDRHSPNSEINNQVLNNSKILKKSLSINSDNTTYMNFVLAQIDELDKTLAEYETLNGNGSYNKDESSMRTRVPPVVAKKPGIEYDNFSHEKLQHKTNSVPNLLQKQINETNNHSNDNSDSASISSNGSSFKTNKKQHPPLTQVKSLNNSNHLIYGVNTPNVTKNTSLSNDTLVQDENENNRNQYNEPEIDYNDEEVYINDEDVNNKTVTNGIIPPPPPPAMLSTFSTNIKSSPLTPRQIKQRNSAKRTTVPRSDSQSNLNDAETNHQTSTNVNHVPPPPPPPLSIVPPLTLSLTPQVNNKNRASSQPPVTPTRTTSTLVYINTVNPKPVVEEQQSSPMIKSQTFTNGPINNGNDPKKLNQQLSHRNELEKAIENRIRRANGIVDSPPETPTKATINPVVIQNGIVSKRISNINDSSPQHNGNKTSTFSKPTTSNEINDLNKRNLPRDPPPPPPPVSIPPVLNGSNKSVIDVTIPPPPPPPSMQTIIDHNSNLPPPPSPTQLNRLNKIISVTPVVKPISPPNKPNLTSPSGGTVIDPRTSSDFSALIAKKAAEKRAKFQETKPSVNAVTFQADGSKIFSTPNSPINSSENVENNDNQSESPVKSSNYLKQNGNNIFKKFSTATPKELNNNSAAELALKNSKLY